MKQLGAALLAVAIVGALVGCQTYGVREVKHERLDEVSGARLELYIAKVSAVDDRPLNQKTLKVLTAAGTRLIYVETLGHDAAASTLQVNRDGHQHEATPNDWAQYKQYMRNFEEPTIEEGPANVRQRER